MSGIAESGQIYLVNWLSGAPRKVLDLLAVAYADVGDRLPRYIGLDPDSTDVALVWFAQETGCRAVLTADARDFGVFRVGKNRRFEVVEWCK